MEDTVAGSVIITPAALGADPRARFIEALYELHSRIFSGVDKKTFVAYVVDRPAERTRIRMYLNRRGARRAASSAAIGGEPVTAGFRFLAIAEKNAVPV
jgi:hypothetical protein